MRNRKINRILEKIAKDNHTTPEIVQREMQAALDEAQANTDPMVQAHWNSIPHQGNKVTLEEFLESAAERLSHS